MSVDLATFYTACPGVVLTRDIEAAIAALPASSNSAAIQAVVLPLMPEGNPFEYTSGAPPAIGTLIPGATPVFAAALPPQPDVVLTTGANPAFGMPNTGTVATFATGLKLFQDSNPDPTDGWSIEFAEGDFPGMVS